MTRQFHPGERDSRYGCVKMFMIDMNESVIRAPGISLFVYQNRQQQIVEIYLFKAMTENMTEEVLMNAFFVKLI